MHKAVQCLALSIGILAANQKIESNHFMKSKVWTDVAFERNPREGFIFAIHVVFSLLNFMLHT